MNAITVFSFQSIVWCLEVHLKTPTMAMIEAALKSPSIPLFQSGTFRSRILTPPFDGLRADFRKRGEGEIFWRSEGELCRELLGQNTS
jgi:hypothetical protein